MVIRQIRAQVPSLEKLGLPAIAGELALEQRGIVFVVGATGSGKSTTLASMIQQRNQFGSGHIVTVEDRSSICTSTATASSLSARSA